MKFGLFKTIHYTPNLRGLNIQLGHITEHPHYEWPSWRDIRPLYMDQPSDISSVD